MMKALKALGHIAVDAFELGNEFTLRCMERTGFLRPYLRWTLRFSERVATGFGQESLFTAKDIEDLVTLAAATSHDTHEAMAKYMHDVIDQGTFETKEDHIMAAALGSLDKLMHGWSPESRGFQGLRVVEGGAGGKGTREGGPSAIPSETAE